LEAIFYVHDRLPRNGVANGDETTPGDSELRRAERHFRPMITEFMQSNLRDILFENEAALRRACGVGTEMTEENQSQLLRQMADCLAPKVFIYLLRNGGLPSTRTQFLRFVTLLTQWSENRAFRNTESTPGDVLSVFSAIAIVTLDSSRARVKNFLLQNHEALFHGVSEESPPDCRKSDSNIFCQWGRELACNETIFPDVYNFFRDNRYRFFQIPKFQNTHVGPLSALRHRFSQAFGVQAELDATAHDLMTEIYEEFSFGPRSTLCMVPPFFNEKD
jgi:hypothetical protein